MQNYRPSNVASRESLGPTEVQMHLCFSRDGGLARGDAGLELQALLGGAEGRRGTVATCGDVQGGEQWGKELGVRRRGQWPGLWLTI